MVGAGVLRMARDANNVKWLGALPSSVKGKARALGDIIASLDS